MVASMAPLLAIPTVTEADLRAFHKQHYPGSPAPTQLFARHTTTALYENVIGSMDESDDGLGYYPDGVKRTLTDTQIDLFRHTEIQMILRARKRQREAEFEDEQGLIDQSELQSSATSPVNGPDRTGQGSPTVPSTKSTHTGHVCPTQSVPSSSANNTPPTSSHQQMTGQTTKSKKSKAKRRNKSDLDRPDACSTQNRKRKWSQYVPDGEDNNSKAHTHRRLAREMDEVPTPASNADLMYGDEDDDMPLALPVTHVGPPPGRKLTSYVD